MSRFEGGNSVLRLSNSRVSLGRLRKYCVGRWNPGRYGRWKTHFFHQILEPRVRSQRISHGIDTEIRQAVIALMIRRLQPMEGLVPRLILLKFRQSRVPERTETDSSPVIERVPFWQPLYCRTILCVSLSEYHAVNIITLLACQMELLIYNELPNVQTLVRFPSPALTR
jgi:hypothetical protein